MENALKQRSQFGLCPAQIQCRIRLFFDNNSDIRCTMFNGGLGHGNAGIWTKIEAKKLTQHPFQPVPDNGVADFFGN